MKLLRFAMLLVVAVACAGCAGDSKKTSAQGAAGGLFGPSPKQLVRQMFESPDPDLRRSAIEKLSRKKRGRREPYLKAYAAMVDDPAATVRSAAVRALGRSGDSRFVKPVVAALKDSDKTVRWDAAVALDSLADDQAILPLSDRAVGDAHVDVRAAAAKALRHYRRREVLDTLLKCLEDPAFGVRFQAAEALRELTGESRGTESQQWRKILAARPDPFGAPAEPKRPWWDLFGLTKPKATPTTGPAGK